MLYSSEQFDTLAKQLAMFAHSRINSLRSELDTESPEVTSAVLSLMPHIVEKAIATSSGLSGDISATLSNKFVSEFEVVAKIQCNVGGFSNPLKKALFNASFHTMFSREYNKLKPIVDSAWHQARQSHLDPTEALGWCVIAYCQSMGGLPKLPDSTVDSVCANVGNIFLDVHQMISPDGHRGSHPKAESNQRQEAPKHVPSKPPTETGQATQFSSDQPTASNGVPVIKSVISCPDCGAQLRVPAGRHLEIRCPKCNTKFQQFT